MPSSKEDLICAIKIFRDFGFDKNKEELSLKTIEELQEYYEQAMQDMKDEYINQEYEKILKILQTFSETDRICKYEIEKLLDRFLIDEYDIFHRERFDAIMNEYFSDEKIKTFLLEYLKLKV